MSQKFGNILLERIHAFFYNTRVSQKFGNILLERIHAFFYNTRMSQKFGNILLERIHAFFYNTRVSQKFGNILLENTCRHRPIGYWVERSPIARETGFQSQVESYENSKNGTWYLLA